MKFESQEEAKKAIRCKEEVTKIKANSEILDYGKLVESINRSVG